MSSSTRLERSTSSTGRKALDNAVLDLSETMRNLRARRFGARVVEHGKYKGALHVATRTWQRFRGELIVLDDYLGEGSNLL